MYANGDAAKMAQAWTAAQQKMWTDWLQLMQSAPAMGAEQWQELARQSMQTWIDNAEPTAKRAAEQMLNGQEAAFAFLQTAASAWSEIAAQLADGDEWRSVVDDYAQRLRAELTAGAGQWAGTIEQMAQTPKMWQSYMQPWSQLWQQTANQWQLNGATPNFGMMGDVVSQTFDVYQQTFGRFLDTPPLGYAREYEEKSRYMAKVLQEYAVATAEYQAVMADAWANGLTKLMEALVARAKEGNPIRTFQELSNEWATIADPAFYEVFVGEKYVRAQGKLLTATMNYRIAQRQFVEMMAKALDMPTRTEVDAAHKSIYEQRRELRSMKKALADANAKIAALEAALEAAVVDMQSTATAVAESTAKTVAESAAKPVSKRTSTGRASTKRTTRKSDTAKETAAQSSTTASSTTKRSATKRATTKRKSGSTGTAKSNATTEKGED